MLTGRQPFTGETPIQVAFQHVNNDVPAPSELVDWLPIEIDDAVRALAARDPDDRPVDAAAALALLRRTRAALDDETLARHAAVAPSIVLPTATDPAETDLDADDDESRRRRRRVADDEPTRTDDDETTLIETGDARGTTVALPIGLGVGAEVLTGSPGRAAAPERHRARWIVLLAAARRADRRRHLVVPAAGPGRLHDRPDDHRSGRGGGDRDPRARRARRRPDVRVRRRGARSARSSRRPRARATASARTAPSRSPISKGPDYVAVPDGVVGEMQADAEAALVAAGLKATYAEPEYSDTVPNAAIISATLPDGTPAEPGAQTIRGTEVRLTVSKGPEPVTITSVVGTTRRGRHRPARRPTTSSSRRPRSSATRSRRA